MRGDAFLHHGDRRLFSPSDVGGDREAGVVVDELVDHTLATAGEDVFGPVELPADVRRRIVARPLVAHVGDRMRVWVVDVGPNVASSFHVVGGQFDTVFSEGDNSPRAGGSTGTGGSQALALSAAQGGFVELAFLEAGHYPFISHATSDAEKGAKGVFGFGN